ncbi:hypothetical protein LTR37_012438 [Vermiconidia calcicola]|uniref:Uncharacterized protein n=1 Tax=Vermiconidia calcicola TaxID=1690605 RepID=A0ACC3MZX4_9PEZI|nr:hypothetical protein LTR37_012438 [Vermiconidia calcicola]
MFGLVAALVAGAFLPLTAAQDDTRYTVWSSVIFSRTGERTPAVFGTIPTQLTSLGAQQQESNGAFFRQRYLDSPGYTNSTSGLDGAPVVGLSPDIPDVRELYVQALDQQTTIASALAFLQGLYPPISFADDDDDVQELIDPTSKLANNTYVTPPLDGYRYAQVHTSGVYDPEFVYLGGSLECPAFSEAVNAYTETAEFAVMQASTMQIYQNVGPVLLSDVLPSTMWSYVNAYAIYDYLNYHNAHNVTVASLLSDPDFINPGNNISYLDRLRWLADEQMNSWLGNLYAENDYSPTSGFVPGVRGSISTIAGNTLAARMLGQLQTAVQYQGEYYKLSLLFGDFEPLMSLFALLDLPPWETRFLGLPNFGSVAVFELFSSSELGTVEFPSEEDLWVRFYFRNGTDSEEPYQAYPIFNHGPDSFEMQWTEFEAAMSEIAVGNIGDWCSQCAASYSGSDRIFCSYWNASDSIDFETLSTSSHHHKVSPAVAGVIGAIVAHVVAGLLFGLLMLVGGVRFHRVRSHKSEMGGFKGSQKMASDKDLVLPKGGAIVGATVETPSSPVTGNERVGSWELKQHDLPNIMAPRAVARRPSYEDDDVGDVGAQPFRQPVQPDERV